MSSNSSNSAGCNGNNSNNMGEGSTDNWEYIAETLKDITVAPLITGIIQGFVSVGMQRRRELRAEREVLKKAGAAEECENTHEEEKEERE